MIKVGAITIDVSHPKAFSQILAEGDRAKYVAVYNDGFRGNDEVEAFAKKMDLKICNTIEELADMVDIAFVHCCNWDKHLDYVKPFIDRNKPIFIDKPIVGNMKDLRILEDLCAKGAKIIGTSALRYCEEVENVKAALKEQNAKPLHTVVTVGSDDFNYAVHGVELMSGFYDVRPVSCKLTSVTEVDGQHLETYFVRFEDGTSAQYISNVGKFVYFYATIVTTNPEFDKDYGFKVDNSKFYKKMLDNVMDYVDGKENKIITCQQMCDAIKIMLAGKASKENGGIEVSLDSELLDTVAFDGNAFEAAYSAKASKMYLN